MGNGGRFLAIVLLLSSFSASLVFAASELKLALTARATFALKNDSLYFWGTSDRAQAPIGEPLVVQLKAMKLLTFGRSEDKLVSVGSGNNHVCGLFESGRLKCWGDNANGQLGFETRATPIGNGFNQALDRLPYVELGTHSNGDQKKVTRFVTADTHTCAILDDSSVRCWGANNIGQLGNEGGTLPIGNTKGQMGNKLEPVHLPKNVKPLEIAAAGLHTCILSDQGEVFCWGANPGLGNGTTLPVGAANTMGEKLKPVNLGAKALKIQTGTNFTCALLETQELKCWGDGSIGVLGTGAVADHVIGTRPDDMGEKLQKVMLGSDLGIEDFACGYQHCCALMQNGAPKCWGRNTEGELGLGDARLRGNIAAEMGENLPFVDLGRLAEVRNLYVGPFHNCVEFGTGEVKCWGLNSGGQGGTGTQVNIGITPQQLGSKLVPVAFPD